MIVIAFLQIPQSWKSQIKVCCFKKPTHFSEPYSTIMLLLSNLPKTHQKLPMTVAVFVVFKQKSKSINKQQMFDCLF